MNRQIRNLPADLKKSNQKDRDHRPIAGAR